MKISIVLLVLLLACFAFAAFKIYQKSQALALTSGTKEYAKWARKNKFEARWILLIFNIAMMVCGLCIGLACYQSGMSLGEPAMYLGLGMFALGTILFPSKDKSDPRIASRFRKKQLLSVLRISGSSLALMAFASNYLSAGNESLVTEASVHPAILFILATVGLLVFGYAILALSCGLACAGHEAAALTLAVGGGTGLIILYIYVLRKIFQADKKKVQKKQEGDTLDEIL